MMTLVVAALAQTGVLLGTVRADSSLEPIGHAAVAIEALERTTVADGYGRFVLRVPAGTWTVTAEAPGYAPGSAEAEIRGDGATRVELRLDPQPIGLGEIRASAAAMEMDGAELPPVRISVAEIKRAPGLAEADVLRALHRAPAVAEASDFSSALYVRGATPDRNLITLDGAPLFNPYHLGGVFATIDPDAVADVEIFPGGFPAGMGDRTASVTRIRTRDGGRDRVRGHGALGLVSSRAGIDGPLPGRRGSYLLSARRTYLDVISGLAHELAFLRRPLPYRFTDAHAKLTHDLGPLGMASLSGYVDREALDMGDAFDLGGAGDWRWGTRMASLRTRTTFGNGLRADLRAAYSLFHVDLALEPDEERGPRASYLDATARMRDVLAGVDVGYDIGRHEIRAGVQTDTYLFEYDLVLDSQLGELTSVLPEDIRHTERFTTIAAYVEDVWRLSDGVDLRVGARLLDAGAIGREWMPRAGVRGLVSDRLALSLAAGRSAQPMYSVRNEEAAMASLFAYDLLVAADSGGMPVTDDIVASVEWAPGRASFRMDVYHKWLRRTRGPVVPRDPRNAPILVIDSIDAGTGMAAGVEVSARYTGERLELAGAYAFNVSRRTIRGQTYTPRFNRPHVLDLNAGLSLGGDTRVDVRFALASGYPYTPVVGLFERTFAPLDPDDIVGRRGATAIMSEHNSERLPFYTRTDAAIRTEIDQTWFGFPVRARPYFQVLNLFGNRNALWAEPQVGRGSTPSLVYGPQMPVVPTFGLEWAF